MNLYKTYGKGLALGSCCVIAAPTELRAKTIHFLETGRICDRIKLVESELEVTVAGNKLSEYAFFIWNGDY